MEEKIINLSSTQGSENLPRPKPKRVRNHIKKHGRKYGLSIVSIAFILGIFFGAHLAVIYSNVQEIRRIAPSLPVLLQGRDFSDARELLQKIDVKLFGSQKLFNRIKIFENIPVIGKHLRGARDLVDAGTLASEAAIEASSFLAEIPYSEADGITYKDVDYSSREFILTRIEESQEVIAKILSNIQAARAKIANISEKDVAEIIVGNAERLDRKLAAAEKILINADPLIKIVPELAGFSQEKKYLFLLLNNDELRPTGGFVSAYGIIDIKNGTFTNFYLDDTWNLDKKFISRLKNQAPAPIVKYNYFHPWYPNTTGEWFFRDITWPPDFVETATIAEEAFLREAEGLNIGIKTAQDIDGVIAVTPTFISDLLELSGNLEIREYFIGSNNLADVLEYESHIGHAKAGLPTDKRKELILKSLVQMFNNIFDLENDNWPELVNILFDNLNKKHVVVYSKNQEVQNELEEMNWAGEIRDYAGDYLLVTDANLASLKTNRFVDRTVYYEIIPNGNFGYKAKVDIIYKHYGEPSYKVTEKYGAYVKIYVPLGAKFVKVTGNQDKLDRGQELGKQWFGTYFSLNTGEEKTLTFEYQLPEFITKQIESGEYKLFVQKQIGSVNDYLRLNLGFHEQIVGAKPEELKELQGDNLYEQEMKFDSDMEFLLQIVN